jgi:hypothetical protein
MGHEKGRDPVGTRPRLVRRTGTLAQEGIFAAPGPQPCWSSLARSCCCASIESLSCPTKRRPYRVRRVAHMGHFAHLWLGKLPHARETLELYGVLAFLAVR